MPLIVNKKLPAYEKLRKELVSEISTEKARKQDIRPLEIGILNLMPSAVVERTEMQLLRLLANTPLQIRPTFIYFDKHKSISSQVHFDAFYKTIAQVKKQGLDGLIITQPGKDYTDKELRRIDEFLMHGNKSLVVFASAVNLKSGDGSMKATLSTHGLEKLLAGYGIEMKKDAVLDWQRSMRLPVMTQNGAPTWIRAPAIVQVQHDPRFDDDHQVLDDGFAAFFRADELSFPFPSTLVAHPDKQPEAKLKVVARTTTAAWAETTDTVDLKISPSWRAKPPLDQRAIAIVVEGTLHSALGPGDGVEVPAVSKEKSRVLVISSAGFLTNPFARSGAGTDLGGQFAQMGPVGGDEQLQMISQPYAQKYLTGTILSFKNTLD